jgi:hypothetical protein
MVSRATTHAVAASGFRARKGGALLSVVAVPVAAVQTIRVVFGDRS